VHRLDHAAGGDSRSFPCGMETGQSILRGNVSAGNR
jgi:hypothetical protein